MTPAGFPHSDISGSTSARDSPKLFAACRVLHRLLAPRHPPRALCSLTPTASDHEARRAGDPGSPCCTRRNRSFFNLPKHIFQLSRCGSEEPRAVAALDAPALQQFCWSVSPGVAGITDQESGRWVETQKRRLGFRAVVMDSVRSRAVVSGLTRVYSVTGWMRSCAGSEPRVREWWRRGDSNS